MNLSDTHKAALRKIVDAGPEGHRGHPVDENGKWYNRRAVNSLETWGLVMAESRNGLVFVATDAGRKALEQ